MLRMEIDEIKKIVSVEVDGYISKKDCIEFSKNYKLRSKNIKGKNYRLVVIPKSLNYESDSDIKDLCMLFFKTGYKKIYMVTRVVNILDTIKISNFERKMISKMVNMIDSINDIN